MSLFGCYRSKGIFCFSIPQSLENWKRVNDRRSMFLFRKRFNSFSTLQKTTKMTFLPQKDFADLEKRQYEFRDLGKYPKKDTYWKHVKGGIYRVQSITMRESDQEYLVNYENINHPLPFLFSRPLKEWKEYVYDANHSGGPVLRFVPLIKLPDGTFDVEPYDVWKYLPKYGNIEEKWNQRISEYNDKKKQEGST